MGYCQQLTLPTAEPITLAYAKNYLRLDPTMILDDTLITNLIQAAREHAERITCRALARRTFRMVLDSMPYFTDTIQSQLAYPPSYYSLPRWSSTLWNYSQMIKLPFAPVISVQQMRYIDNNGASQTLNQDTDFVLDRQSEPARIFPIPGSYWPSNFYVANSCIIDFTAGFTNNLATGPDTHDFAGSGQQPDSIIVPALPATILRCILLLIGFWYENRTQEADPKIDSMLQNEMVIDFQPTRG
jgi:hypothetical protein